MAMSLGLAVIYEKVRASKPTIHSPRAHAWARLLQRGKCQLDMLMPHHPVDTCKLVMCRVVNDRGGGRAKNLQQEWNPVGRCVEVWIV